MDTKQIWNDLSQMCTPNKNFTVLPADHLPKKKIKIRPFNLVINTDESFKPGEHWISIHLPKNRKEHCEYFDSFGLPAINPYFIDFLNTNCKQYVYNPIQIQSDDSNLCGEYCVMFLHERNRNKTFGEFINMFDEKKPEKNDKKIINMYKKMHRHTKRARAKMTQLGGGIHSNHIVCNQSCVSRKQNKKKS